MKNHLKIITPITLNLSGRTNDRQKATQAIPQTDGQISLTGPHWRPFFPSMGGNYCYYAVNGDIEWFRINYSCFSDETVCRINQ